VFSKLNHLNIQFEGEDDYFDYELDQKQDGFAYCFGYLFKRLHLPSNLRLLLHIELALIRTLLRNRLILAWLPLL
jgi:hypothetical protein